MLNLKGIEAKILNLLELKKGWNYGEGEEIRKENAYIAIAIVRKIDDEYIEGINVTPTDYGEVNLDFNLKNGDTISVFIDYEQNEVTSYVETQDDIRDFKVVKIEGVAKHIQEEIVKCKINAIAKENTDIKEMLEKCLKYIQDLYTNQSFMERKISPPQKFSYLRIEKEKLNGGYRSLTPSALQIKTGEYADMSKLTKAHTIALATHVFSGPLTKTCYRMPLR